MKTETNIFSFGLITEVMSNELITSMISKIIIIIVYSLTAWHVPLVKSPLTSLDDRFNCLLEKLDIAAKRTNTLLDLKFDDDVFAMAAALDPMFVFHWLQDHPGSKEDTNAVRLRITSEPCILNDFEQYGKSY
jgi:hypothetical protein